MIEITQEFGFDAAHYLGVGAGQRTAASTAISFYVDVTLRGEPSAATGVLRDLGEVERALKAVRADAWITAC